MNIGGVEHTTKPEEQQSADVIPSRARRACASCIHESASEKLRLFSRRHFVRRQLRRTLLLSGDHTTVSTAFRYGQMREDRARKRKNSDCDPASMSLSVVAPQPFTLSQVRYLSCSRRHQ